VSDKDEFVILLVDELGDNRANPVPGLVNWLPTGPSGLSRLLEGVQKGGLKLLVSREPVRSVGFP